MADAAAEVRTPSLRLKLAVGAAGVGSSAAQVLIIRELMVASAGNELSISAVLSLWLLWSGVGSWLGGRFIARSERAPEFHLRWIALAQVLVLSGCLVAARAGLYALRGLFGGALVELALVPPAGGTLSLPQLLLLTTGATAPAGLLLGWQFAAGANALSHASSAPDGPQKAYVIDSLGHLIGGAIVAIPAVIAFPADATMIAACMIVLAAVALLSRSTVQLAGVILATLALGAITVVTRPITLHARWHPHTLRASYESPYGNISVLQAKGGERSFFINGAHAFETADALAGEQWVDLPLLAHESPRTVLLIGGGPRVVRQILRHDPDAVEYWELDPTAIRGIREHAPRELAAALDDPRVTVQLGDARRMTQATEDLHYDVIIVAIGDPTTAQLNRYYTLEWFRQARRLTGMVAFQAMSSGDYLGEDLRAYNACLYQTAEEAGLPHVDVFPGPHATFICSLAGAEIFDDPAGLSERIAERGLDEDQVLASFYDALDPFRREDRSREMREAESVRLNRDSAPTCYYYAQVLWASWWRGGTSDLLRSASTLRLTPLLAVMAIAAVVLLCLEHLARRRWRIAGPVAVFAAGACGMALEIVLLLSLQSRYGYVYGVVGLVIGFLMAGLAFGAWLAGTRPLRPLGGVGVTVGLGLTAVCAIAIGIGVNSSLAAPGSAPFVAITCAAMAVVGLAVGLVYPFVVAATRSGDSGVRRATMLYGVDLIGACGGALLAGLILVPLLGSAGTCWAAAVMAGGAAAVALTAHLKG